MYLFKLFKISSLEAAADPEVWQAGNLDPRNQNGGEQPASRFVLARGG